MSGVALQNGVQNVYFYILGVLVCEMYHNAPCLFIKPLLNKDLCFCECHNIKVTYKLNTVIALSCYQ